MKGINWTQALACAVAGLVGGLLAAMLLSKPAVWLGLTGISAGEWLQAGAAIIGVFLTVTATLWLEQKKREHERKEEQRLIREVSIGVQKGPPIGVQKGPPSSSSVTGMTGAPFALVAA